MGLMSSEEKGLEVKIDRGLAKSSEDKMVINANGLPVGHIGNYVHALVQPLL